MVSQNLSVILLFLSSIISTIKSGSLHEILRLGDADDVLDKDDHGLESHHHHVPKIKFCDKEKYYAEDVHNCAGFLQRDEGGEVYKMPCAGGTHWNQKACTCVQGDCKGRKDDYTYGLLRQHKHEHQHVHSTARKFHQSDKHDDY